MTDKPGKYKPALRGAAFSNRINAKKSNQLRARGRMQTKINAERAGRGGNAYGGVGAQGLDFGGDGGEASKAK